jgi:hypothetical protein
MAAEFFTPGFCRIASNAGVDFIIFDMEPGGVGIDVLKAQMGFARGAGVTPIVRVQGIAYHLVAPILDAGPDRRHGAGTARKACEAGASASPMTAIAAATLSRRWGKRMSAPS